MAELSRTELRHLDKLKPVFVKRLLPPKDVVHKHTVPSRGAELTVWPSDCPRRECYGRAIKDARHQGFCLGIHVRHLLAQRQRMRFRKGLWRVVHSCIWYPLPRWRETHRVTPSVCAMLESPPRQILTTRVSKTDDDRDIRSAGLRHGYASSECAHVSA